MEKQWFLLVNDKISGPLGSDEIDELIKASDQKVQIWGKGAPEWMDVGTWKKSLAQIQENLSKSREEAPNWRLRIEGKEFGPMTFSDLIRQLRVLEDLENVDVLGEDSNHWREIYTIERITQELGISRRSHPRAPIIGTLTGEVGNRSIQARVISISEGGMGISDAVGLSVGETLRCSVNSPNLFLTINCSCEVVYVGKEGYVGLRFTTIPIDAKSSITSYIRKFAGAL